MLSMFEIVTDSSANLTDELIEQYQLPILSLTVRVAEVSTGFFCRILS